MVTYLTTQCDKCIHKKICSIRNQVMEAMNDLHDKFGSDNPYVKFSVRCIDFDDGRALKRSAGFD